ncbi:MAG: pyridoxal-dependent decarboxylase, exosortase A system-associated [Herminiimonas sp.]|nr:pyridoxal-dependent decarboxylase, exosortase A system-associated [Herminiimonas sp.]
MKPTETSHASGTKFMSPFSVEGDSLQVGGIELARLAERAGSTPFYAYDRSVLSTTVARLRAALPPAVHLHYSVKANPMPALVQHMASLVDGFDVASAAEMKTALDTPAAPAMVSFAGPGKIDRDLAMAIAAGVVIHLESEGELARVGKIGKRLRIRPQVALRINPDFELKASGMRMSGGAKQFGIDAEDVPRILDSLGSHGVDFVGFHIYCGSQSLRADAIVESQSRTLQLALRLAESAPAPLRLLNIGGGFGIPYFPGEQELDLAPIAANLHAWMPTLAAQLPHATLVIELGRYLVGPAGVYVSRVVDRKVSRGKVFLVTDGGMNHHLAASGNLGQKIRKNYPVAIAGKASTDGTEMVSVVGPLCTPLDLLADDVKLPVAEVGDLVVVLQSGAYGLSASPTAFLGHPMPTEMLI